MSIFCEFYIKNLLKIEVCGKEKCLYGIKYGFSGVKAKTLSVCGSTGSFALSGLAVNTVNIPRKTQKESASEP